MVGVPMGTIVACLLSAKNIPDRWLPCDGSEIPAEEFQELRTALGSDTTPNLAGRTLIGTGTPDTGQQSDGSYPNFASGAEWTLDFTGGEAAHQLVVGEMPSHIHAL